MEPRIPTIRHDELAARRAAGKGPALLDVLPADRFARVHIPEAMNACVFQVDFLDQVAALGLDPHAELVVYGSSGQTSDAVATADKLTRAGFTQVAILAGGLAEWRDAGLPLAGEPDQQPEPARIPDGRYPVDTAASSIAWAGRNPTTTHHGILRLATGEVVVRNGVISGTFRIDMTSIENLNLAGDELQPVLEAHLKSDDFFFVSRFPEARFQMTATSTVAELPVSAPNYRISGELELCGVRASQEFPATIVPAENGGLAAEAHFDLDRTRWGVIYGSSRFFDFLGMHLVFDLVSLQLRIVTRQEVKGAAS